MLARSSLIISSLLILALAAGCTKAEPSNIPNPIIESSQMATYTLTRPSPYPFVETVNRLRANIEKRPLTLFAEIDHAKGAASIDMNLTPSTLFVFGNPKGGTPLMIQNPQMGIALPLKMHVYESQGNVYLSYTDITASVEGFGLDASAQPVPNIAAMLEGLADDVVGPVQ